MLAVEPFWWIAPVAVAALGLGYYMLHNTLQTNATQMLPEARGTAVAFSSALFLGQTAGVALAAPIVRPRTARCRCSSWRRVLLAIWRCGSCARLSAARVERLRKI